MTDHTKQYSLNHHLVSKVRGPAKSHVCEHCGRPAQDWATVAGFDSERDALDPWVAFIALCRRCHRAYDRRPGPTHWTGRRHQPESIEKIRQAKLGRSNHTPQSRQKIPQALKGRKPSPETLEKIRQARLGVTFSDEARQRMSAGQKRRNAATRDVIIHGTTTGYRKGCKCDDCRAAVTAAARDRRARAERR